MGAGARCHSWPTTSVSPSPHQPRSPTKAATVHRTVGHTWSKLTTTPADIGVKHPRTLQAHTTSAPDDLLVHSWHRVLWNLLAPVFFGSSDTTRTHQFMPHLGSCHAVRASTVLSTGRPPPALTSASTVLPGYPLCGEPKNHPSPCPLHLKQSHEDSPSTDSPRIQAHTSHSSSYPGKVTRHPVYTGNEHTTIPGRLEEVAVLPNS